ncbi:MAG TPA: pre-toxin TG domain-containing protein [Thermoanaerobaculia bacterium]|nr:pre-toxin TG domain-containing protein [Thermoanaerobaculia bacterium]
MVDRRRGISYLYKENALVLRIMEIFAKELVLWFMEYPVDRDFYRSGSYLSWSAREGLLLFLNERRDMAALLRLAQTLPFDTEVSEVPIDRPEVVTAVELLIGLVPIVGTLVALYEAWEGEDLFGYKLTEVDRGILAASALLPLAGRLVKGGRALYTESRLVSMYGRDAAVWSRTLRVSSLATEGMPALRTIEEAEVALRTQGKLDRALAQKAAQELPKTLHAPAAVSSTVDQAISDLLRQLISKQKILQGIDELALQRVLLKGPNVDHLKGQLLEELIEARIVPWLRDRAGSFALGIQTGGKKLEFIPGHLIRDIDGSQITDGILAFRNNGVLEIAAVFEAKAGKEAARELRLARTSLSKMSDAARKTLRAFAKDELREQRAAAKEAGKPFTKTIDEVEREIALSERGGQIRRDIERLSENHDGTLAQIRVGADLVPVRISQTRTKLFGVLPRDVNRALIERELRDCGYSFEILGADISQRELRDLSAEMVPQATKMAASP